MNHSLSSSADLSALCLVESYASASAHASEIDTLAREKHTHGCHSLPPRFLRHADEQTVIGMHSIIQAMAADTQDSRDIRNDAVVAATCLGGQPSAARTMIGLRDKGPVAVTPHIVPQCSLHSVASAASVGFGMHGPNFGVGGGPHAPAEGFLLALTLAPMLARTSPSSRIWLVCTGWDQQPCLDAAGILTNDPICRGMTFVLKPEKAQPVDNTYPHIQISCLKNAPSPRILPAHGRLKELCEQFETGTCTTIAMTDTCTIEISPLSPNQLSSRSNELALQKEAA
jgi:hypothetical protein